MEQPTLKWSREPKGKLDLTVNLHTCVDFKREVNIQKCVTWPFGNGLMQLGCWGARRAW